MPADSLLDIATRACGKISKRIQDVGDIPYDLIRPVLLKIESPEQLHKLEENSPQLIGRDAEIWLALIKRDIPDWQSKRHEPRDPKNWWKVYRKLKEESVKTMASGEDKLKAALDNIQNEKAQNLAQIVTRKELPRSGAGARASMNHRYNSGLAGSKGASKATLMERVKKEARDARTARIASTQQLKQRTTTQISRPPQQFLEDLQESQQASGQHSSPERPIRAPRRMSSIHTTEPVRPDDLSYRQMREREERLRLLTAGRPSVPRVSVESPVSSQLNHPVSPTKTRNELNTLSEDFLESSPPTNSRKALGDGLDRPRTASPGRITSPGPGKLKRKEAPSLFHTPLKKMAKRPEIL